MEISIVQDIVLFKRAGYSGVMFMIAYYVEEGFNKMLYLVACIPHPWIERWPGCTAMLVWSHRNASMVAPQC